MNNEIFTVSELYPGNISLNFHEARLIERVQSQYQLIEVYEHDKVGKILLLDGLIMFTEMDYGYNREMMFNIPMHSRAETERVLIIGGGDGSSPGEALKYPFISKIDVVDIDEKVTEVCIRHFPFLKESFEDERVHYMFQEGSQFVSNAETLYGVIVVSPTDPDTLSMPLYTSDFFQRAYHILDEQGILCIGGFSPFYSLGKLKASDVKIRMEKIFPITKVFFATLPSYPGGVCTYFIASKRNDPAKIQRVHLTAKQYREMSYYNFDIHEGAFKLPQVIRRLVGL